MTTNETPAVGKFRAWVQQPTDRGDGNYVFNWFWAWTHEPRLIVERFTNRPGGMGDASFSLLMQVRQEPWSTRHQTYGGVLVSGMYVAITSADDPLEEGEGTALDPAKVRWCGWISALDYELSVSQLDSAGSASARGLGYLLDAQQITGWRRASPDGAYGEAINSPSAANLGDGTSYVIGNAIQVTNLDGNGTAGFAFARLPADCGTAASKMWTRWRLLQHVRTCCRIPGLPPLTVSTADGSTGTDPSDTSKLAGYLNDTSVPEVFDLRELTTKGALDLCIPRARLVNWDLVPGKVSWGVVIYSGAEAATYGVPINSGVYRSDVVADAQPLTGVRIIDDAGDMPDEVRIEGAPIVAAATVSFEDESLQVGWQIGVQEDAWKTAASGATGYADLSQAVKRERNAAVRARTGLRDVFTKYGLFAYANGNVVVKNPGGDGTGSPAPLVPTALWNGTAVNLFATIDGQPCPYLPTAAILRTLPWPEGVEADGTDRRDAGSKAQPTFMKPKVFRYDEEDEDSPWADLESRNGRSGFPGLSLDVEDRGAAVRLVLSDATYLARDHWDDTVEEPGIADIDPDSNPKAVNYRHLVLTIAMESDQRLLVKAYRPGCSADSDVRRRLVLRDPKLQLWCVPIGTLLNLDEDGEPERASAAGPFALDGSGNYILTRNDYPTAERRLKQACAWAFRKRRAVAITMGSPHLPPDWARVGCLLTSLFTDGTDTPAAHTVINSAVEEVEVDCIAGRITVRTVLPPPPAWATAGGGSPDMGGPVSLSLGGTVPQALRGAQVALEDAARTAQRLPLIVPRSAAAASDYLKVIIKDGNTLDTGQDGVKYEATEIDSVPSAYDPDVDSSFIDGIGRGTLLINNVAQEGYVLVINSPQGGLGNAVRDGDEVWVQDTIAIPVDGGGTVQVYTIS